MRCLHLEHIIGLAFTQGLHIFQLRKGLFILMITLYQTVPHDTVMMFWYSTVYGFIGTVWFSFHWIVQRHMSICLYRSDCITVKERERVEAEEENVEAARKKQEEERKRESQKVGYPYSVRGSQYAFS